MKPIFSVGNAELSNDFELSYDIPAWLKNAEGGKKLEDFKGGGGYRISLLFETKKRIKDIINMNRDFDLSLQMLYRDGSIRDFWPQWVRAI